MKQTSGYAWELALIGTTAAVAVAGFWNLYAGGSAAPDSYHHLHVTTNFAWLTLLFYQATQLRNGNFQDHRRMGLLVLVLGPLLVASTALLSVHSARKGIESGQGDFLIIQNVGVTLELALLIVAAFVVRKRRKLHGSFLMGSVLLFFGIALFFTLISFAPPFKIEGPETFYRFATAGMAGNIVCFLIGLAFFFRDWRNGWPMLIAGVLFPLNDFVGGLLDSQDLIGPLTMAVASLNQPLTYAGTFLVLLAALLATGVLRGRTRPERIPVQGA
ncbi:MAG: hypothetical protein A3E01_15515 [Gammaproteobacteria bacterium RIFCSPHIGHO2_12_FULL_63_22]|nr:MAG: hypothetical protein A3E01_15515 [Gammaproteobacteria bacterium RIFCSPHIGHO2_12_FULL_63_22]